MSCSKVFTSKYGRGFGLVSLILPEDHQLNQPNSVYGIFFYSTLMLLAFINVRFISKVQVGVQIMLLKLLIRFLFLAFSLLHLSAWLRLPGLYPLLRPGGALSSLHLHLSGQLCALHSELLQTKEYQVSK